MADHEHQPGDLSDLDRMAALAEQTARPLPADQVRALGDRRRGRRILATAGMALVTLLVVGAAVVAGLTLVRGPGQVAGPPVGGSPSGTERGTAPPTSAPPTSAPDPSAPAQPARTLTTKNLLTVEDIPLEDYDNQQAAVVKDGVGRPLPESSVCLPPTGLQDLGAGQILHRNFRYELIDGKPDPKDPFRNQPVIYTQALQFGDAAAAAAARDRYRGWLEACPAQLKAKGYRPLPDLGFDTTKITVEKGSATATEIAYQRPGGVDGENGIWESTGLTVVGDRMMVTVYLHWGMDWELSIDSTEGDLLHPQLSLCDYASARLAA